jgi:hypothetical protein
MTSGKVNVLRVNDHEICENLPTDICFLAHVLSVCLDHLPEKSIAEVEYIDVDALRGRRWVHLFFAQRASDSRPIPDVTNAVI